MGALFTSLSQKISIKEGERLALIRQREQLEARSKQLVIDIDVAQKSQALIQDTAKETQNQLRFHLQDLVNTALESVFPGAYEFRLEFVPKRNSTEADIYLLKDGERVDPMDSSGGGVVDIICFALRIVAWSIGKSDNTIILDEPFKWLSVNLRPLAGDLLRLLSKELNLQLIFVTHDPELVSVCDRVFEVAQDEDGVSYVTVIEGNQEQ
jgi:DNA repair exonuclease SbcCD ATPase subunit